MAQALAPELGARRRRFSRALRAVDERRVRLLRTALRWHLDSTPAKLIGVVALAAAFPLLTTDDNALKYADLFLIFGIIVMGLNLQQGYAGIVNLGPSAILGIGAYSSATLSHHLHWPMPLPLLAPLAILFFAAQIVGGAAIILSKLNYTMLSFYSALLIPILASYGGFFTGGNTGFNDIEPLEIAGYRPQGAALYGVLVGLFLIGYAVLRRIVRSRWGRAYVALKDDELAATTFGIAPRESKFGVILIGTLFGLLAGSLYAHAWPGNCIADVPCSIGPTQFGFDLSVLLFAALVLGGPGSLIGPLLGTALLVGLQWFFDPSVNANAPSGDWQTVIEGVILIVVVVALPRGLASFGRLVALPEEVVPRSVRRAVALPPRSRPPLGLQVRGLSVSFGGVVALHGVDLEVQPGRIHALIGPNGSGKTTLVNCVSGLIRADSGEVRLGDAVLTPGPVHVAYRRSRRGLARTFQTPRVQPELRVVENVMQGLFWSGRRLRLPRPGAFARGEAERRRLALQLLAAVGLEHRAEVVARSLPHGERRLVEVARALVGEPGVVLLDEPAAGLSPQESEHLVEVLRACRDWGCAVVLIEHDLRLALDVADMVTVLDRGEVISRGTPAHVRDDPAVARAFMGPVG